MAEGNQSLRESLEKYEPHFLHFQGPLIDSWDSANRCTVTSGNKRYLDFTSGLMMSNCGHVDVGATLQLFGRTSAWYTPTTARLRAYKTLASILPEYLNTYVLNVTGGEAVETALKIACKYKRCSYCDALMAYPPAYHGNHQILDYVTKWATEGKEYVPDGFLVMLLCPFEGPTCRWWNEEFIAMVKDWQVNAGGIVIFDECQAGMGRTGRWFGFDHYDIEPDLVVIGKSMANGWPISAVAGRRDVMNSVQGDFISTYSGQPHCCNAFVDTVDYIDSHNLLGSAMDRGVQIHEWATEHGYKVQGRGLAQAVEVGPDASMVIDLCLEDGLMLLRTEDAGTVKIAPPLIITEEELRTGLDIISRAIAAVGRANTKR
jgi:4-aminobutyrate aminotransferase-like enzyme